jgi:hypothetical protein
LAVVLKEVGSNGIGKHPGSIGNCGSYLTKTV